MDEDTRSGPFGRKRGGARGGVPEKGVGAQPAPAGTDLIGGMVFLLGCLPAVSLIRALWRGTDLTAVGLGGPTRIAAVVSDWVGSWPGLVAAIALTLLGGMMIVGTLRANPLHGVAGVLLSGVGLAVVASAIAPATLVVAGAGGRIGDSTAGELPMVVGLALGLVVMGAATWLCFSSAAIEPAVDEDGFEPILEDERDAAPRPGFLARMGEGAATGLASLKERRASRRGPGLGASNESRRIQPRRQQRRTSPPATLGDAMARRQTEGVSHDEAAALAPDDQALDYMQSVWKNATDSFRQVEPVPPSPYPEDPRLMGQVPEGAKPLDPAAAQAAPGATATPAASLGGAATAIPGHAADPFAAGPELDPDVAPFDFVDGPVPAAELSAAELPLAPTLESPAPPRETFDRPEGVRPITPADTLAQPTEVTLPPQPTWETPIEEDLADELGEPQPLLPEVEEDSESTEETAARLAPEPPVIEDPELIPEVDTATGRWPRKEEEELEAPELEASEVGEELEAAAELIEELIPAEGAPEVDDVVEDAEAELELESDPEVEAEADEEEEVEYEYVDEDGNPIDPEEIDGEWETVEEEDEVDGAEASDEDVLEEVLEDDDPAAEDPEAEEDEEWEEAEDDELELEVEAEADEEEEVEYEYVDEDGNPIDPADLEDGEWEEVEEGDDEDVIEEEVAAEADVVLEPQAPPAQAGKSDAPGPAAPLSGTPGGSWRLASWWSARAEWPFRSSNGNSGASSRRPAPCWTNSSRRVSSARTRAGRPVISF